MRKPIVIILIGILFMEFLIANPIDVYTASKAAKNFYFSVASPKIYSGKSEATLVHQVNTTLDHHFLTSVPVFYVFTIQGNDNYIIVAADDRITPILGYSMESSFSPDHIPPNLFKWLESYKKEISYVLVQHLDASDKIQEAWKQLLSNDPKNRGLTGVNPLLTTKWNQSPHYNALCPGGSVTGCVATAMAQVMKYWNHPAQGTSYHSYNENDYGTLSANFAATTYNWSGMPNVVSNPNNAVATLMYHCGVAVDMNYSPQASAAYTIGTNRPSAELALKTYFKYDPALIGVQKNNFSDAEWVNKIKGELNSGRPVIYAGYGVNGGGHAFVCDGYDNNNYFHFNWGWGGNADGYFSIQALNPGTSNYTSNQQAIIGIKPLASVNTAINLYAEVIANPSPLVYNKPLTVTCDVINKGSATFFGEITAALFDKDKNFVEYIQTLSITNGLPSNYHFTNGLNFVNQGLKATPGAYFIGIFVKPSGQNWIMVNDGAFKNMIPITIIHPNSAIEMYSEIIVTPVPVISDQPFSVWLDVVNRGSTTFKGTISVDIHDADGEWLMVADERSDLSMGPNTHFTNGLTFGSGALFLLPGTYQLVVWYKPDSGEWDMVKGTLIYENPIFIDVVGQDIYPDNFEPNNTETAAYPLPMQFSGNVASIVTTGSNIHDINDIDYYKVILPPGYTYNVTGTVLDFFNSNPDDKYTLDALWAYHTGSGWSETYDDDLTGGPLIISGGKTLLIKAYPLFDGMTGTYMMKLSVMRSPTSEVENTYTDRMITIYPNPADAFIYICNPTDENLNSAEVFNEQGKSIQYIDVKSNSNITINTSTWLPGVYLIRLSSDKYKITKKIFITHN